MWWHFTKKGRNVALRYKLGLCYGSGVEIRINLGGGIYTERPKIYILSYKIALFWIKHRRGISTERPMGTNLHLKISLHLYGGISSESQNNVQSL